MATMLKSVNADKMTDDELLASLHEGFEDAKAGRIAPGQCCFRRKSIFGRV